MGGKFWSSVETRHFMKVIMPQSKCNTPDGSYDPRSPGKGWDELAIIMQRDMDAIGATRRKYATQMMYEHHYQKVRKLWVEFCIKRTVKTYNAAVASGDMQGAARILQACSKYLQEHLISQAPEPHYVVDIDGRADARIDGAGKLPESHDSEDESGADLKDDDVEDDLFVQQHGRTRSTSISHKEAAEIMEVFSKTEVVHGQTSPALQFTSKTSTRSHQPPYPSPAPSAVRDHYRSGLPGNSRTNASGKGSRPSHGGPVRSTCSASRPSKLRPGCRYLPAPTATMYDPTAKNMVGLEPCRNTRKRRSGGGERVA